VPSAFAFFYSAANKQTNRTSHALPGGFDLSFRDFDLSDEANPVCERRVNLLVYSLSLHRHSYIGFILAFASSIHNKQQQSDDRLLWGFEGL
jgi:hypothetical protein